ncbi:hypothetical protein U5B43_00120 [Campylobacter sp. 9BO]|uniref:hypothetical protein n=1 Tax=Campylobacter sp. 9BO TaxID=3424759 RepID=UPI003D33D9D4
MAFLLFGYGVFSFYAKSQIKLLYHALFLLAYLALFIVIFVDFYRGFNGILLLFYAPLFLAMFVVMVLNFTRFKKIKNALKK